MFDDPVTQEAVRRIFPLIPWALREMQTKIDPLTLGDFDGRVRAGMTHRLVMEEGRRRFDEVNGIEVVTTNQLSHFICGDLLIRVKHSQPRSWRIAINPTVQTARWTNLPLAGVPDPRNFLHLVYVPDRFWTTVHQSAIGEYYGDEPRRWREIDVEGWLDAGGASVTPMTPLDDIPPLTLKPGATPLPIEGLDGTA